MTDDIYSLDDVFDSHKRHLFYNSSTLLTDIAIYDILISFLTIVNFGYLEDKINDSFTPTTNLANYKVAKLH